MINITHGIFDITKDTSYKADGFFHNESRVYMALPLKFRDLLIERGNKFLDKYKKGYIQFVYGLDSDKHISAISICHPYFDFFDRKLGEDIVIGRIRRMRGNVKDIIYEKEDYIDYYIKKDKDGKVVYKKQFVRKRVKKDENNEPIIRKTVWFKPYDLDEVICDKDGDFLRYKYPYVYKLEA